MLRREPEPDVPEAGECRNAVLRIAFTLQLTYAPRSLLGVNERTEDGSPVETTQAQRRTIERFRGFAGRTATALLIAGACPVIGGSTAGDWRSRFVAAIRMLPSLRQGVCPACGRPKLMLGFLELQRECSESGVGGRRHGWPFRARRSDSKCVVLVCRAFQHSQ